MSARSAILLSVLLLSLIFVVSIASSPLPSCEWCGGQDAPASLTSTSRIAPPGEKGDLLLLEGVVRDASGKAVPGVLIYAYHTDSKGIYPKRGNESGNGRRHGYLRGWVRSGEKGDYRFKTIRPGSYPQGGNPAHIHMTVTPRGGSETYVSDVVFTDDPILTGDQRRRQSTRGGSGITTPVRDEHGVWQVRRDIILPNESH